MPRRTSASGLRLKSTSTISAELGQTSQVNAAGGPSLRIGGPEAQASSKHAGRCPRSSAAGLDQGHAQCGRLASFDLQRQPMGPLGMSDLEPTADQARPDASAGSSLAASAAGAHDPAAQPVATRRLDQGLWRHRPGELAGLRRRRSGPRPAADSCATASGRSSRLRFRGHARRVHSRPSSIVWGSTTVKTTRRTAEFGTAAGLRRRIKRPAEALPAAGRLPR